MEVLALVGRAWLGPEEPGGGCCGGGRGSRGGSSVVVVGVVEEERSTLLDIRMSKLVERIHIHMG